MRIAVGSIIHEANTFRSERIARQDVDAHPFLRGRDVIEKARTLDTAVPGFLSVGDDVEWVPLISSMLPGGAGKLTMEAYHYLEQALVDSIRAAGALDGCLLSLHGSMGAVDDDYADADGQLLTAARAALPPTCRLGVTLDLHANLTERMVAAADVMLAYQTFPPHWDKTETGARASQLLQATVRGEIRPVMALTRPPMMLQPEAQDSRRSPMKDVMERARRAEQQPGMLAVSMIAGFAWCDVPEAGTSVLAIADGDGRLAEETANDLAEYWFSRRDDYRFELVPVEEAISRALAAPAGKPVLLCDHADNVGAGGAGDSTFLLDALLRHGVQDTAYGVIADPVAVGACVEAGVGARLSLEIGGRIDPEHNRSLTIDAYVRAITDGRYRNTGPLWTGAAGNMGRSVVLEVGGIELIVTERPNGAFDPSVFRSVGIEPTTKKILVVKSQIFAPEALASLVSESIIVDGEGWGTSNFSRLPYSHVRRPIFPLDEHVTFTARQPTYA